MTDRMPTIGTYRGAPLHDFQSLCRIEDVVKPGIDAVHATSNVANLYDFACDYWNSPEARLFAAAKVRAIFGTRAAAHENRGDIDLESLLAASLASTGWTYSDNSPIFVSVLARLAHSPLGFGRPCRSGPSMKSAGSSRLGTGPRNGSRSLASRWPSPRTDPCRG
jgi:hypothetical protein